MKILNHYRLGYTLLAVVLMACSSDGKKSSPTVSSTNVTNQFCAVATGAAPVAGAPAAGSPGFTALSDGQASAQIDFTLPGGMVSLISFEQKCDSPGSADGCCALLLYPADQSSCPAPTAIVADPSSGFLSAQLEPADDLKISGRVFAESACAHTQPTLTSVAPASTVTTVSGAGQSSTHTDVELQSIGGRIIFRDISRRENLNMGGKLNPRSSISVVRQVDYQANDPFYTEELVSGDNFDSTFSPLFSQHSYDATALPTTDFDIRALDALGHSQVVYDYFLESFKRNSYDNRGSSMRAVIESPTPSFDTPDECNGGVIARGSENNASFDSKTLEIYFTPVVPGEGYNKGLSASLDVTAHEWGHAFLDQESNLIYQGESGALNEAFADWTSVAVSDSVGQSDWQIGNDYFRPDETIIKDLIRDMSMFREVDDELWLEVQCASSLCNDFCGVHSNSGVPNHMFHLLSVGFESRADAYTPLAGVVGIGIEKAYQIAVAANQDFWTTSTNFLAARSGMEMAARMLFTDQPEIEASVSTAWALVGVGTAPTALPSATTPAVASSTQASSPQ
ncbi:MAG: M4 family metallopeptidase [Proteobacteria bacterium]|nr:M4 family metallopeptidase [Pseudomonadota bacterium]